MKPQKTKITTLFFDFGRVLIDIDKQKSLCEWRNTTGLSDEQYFYAFFGDGSHHLLSLGTLTPDNYFDRVIARTPASVTHAQIKMIYKAILRPRRKILSKVRELTLSYRVGVISDTDPFHLSVMKGWPGILDGIDPIITSFSMGCTKPNPKIYLEACMQAGCIPEEAVFFDDLLRNIEGARKLGMTAHHIKDPKNLYSLLMTGSFA